MFNVTKHPFFSKLSGMWDYVPFMLVTLMFVAEAEMGNHLAKTGWKVGLTMLIIVLLYICIVVFKLQRAVVFIIAAVLWVIFIYVKRCLLL